MHDTCVGVVFWFLGLLVPLFRLANVSCIFFVLMKEKATKKNSKTAFQKILNYLLFQDFSTPDFSFGNANLSKSFIESNKITSTKTTFSKPFILLTVTILHLVKLWHLNSSYFRFSRVVSFIFIL